MMNLFTATDQVFLFVSKERVPPGQGDQEGGKVEVQHCEAHHLVVRQANLIQNVVITAIFNVVVINIDTYSDIPIVTNITTVIIISDITTHIAPV